MEIRQNHAHASSMVSVGKWVGLALSVVWLTACGQQTWTGIIYLDRADLTRSVTLGTFRSLDMCRQACQSALDGRGALNSGDYECGLNCEVDRELGGISVCSRTER